MKQQTRCIHSIPVDPLTGAISTPIYQTSTFVQSSPGVHQGFDYARSNNPTRLVLENLLAELEHGDKGFAFSSGLAAIDSVLKLLEAGDEIIAVDDIYGGAFRLFTHVYEKFGISVRYVDTTNTDHVAKAISTRTKLLWIETPTNPTLKISDIAGISDIAKRNNILLCVDNTFASPAAQLPLDLGADIVVHSATKYLGGHSDLIAGAVITRRPEISEKIKFVQNASGAILSPFDSWLVIRGIETLPLRYEQHSKNAHIIAEFLAHQPEINNVYYPGLKGHQNHDVAIRQQGLFGGIISFDLHDDDKQLATYFVTQTKLFKLAESLGGAKSLICQPCEMTHKSIPREKRYHSGVTDSLIRISVGLEDVNDLIQDLQFALNEWRKKAQTQITCLS